MYNKLESQRTWEALDRQAVVDSTAAQRKQAQRERDMTAIFEPESDTWTEAQCMLVWGSARFPKGSPLQKAAWLRLGQIGGFA